MSRMLLIAAALAATAIAVPAAQAQNLPEIPKGNHYICYPAKSAQSFKMQKAVFEDQFGKWNVYVLGITRVCTPALKRYNNTTSEPVDKMLHQVCYRIRLASKNRLPYVMTNDQFGLQKKVALAPPTEVCLPAGKMPIKG